MNRSIAKFKYARIDTREKGDKMKRKSRIAIFCFISALILGIVVTYVTPMMFQSTEIKCYSDVSELGHPVTLPDVTGATFSVAVVLENVTELYGLDVQFNWTTQWITYTGRTVTIPIETYSSTQPPSPYAGILHEPYMTLKNVVDESASIPDSETGTMGWFGYAIMPGASLFNGSGTICVFDFLLHNQPYSYEGNTVIKIHFVKTSLSNAVPAPIPHTTVDLEIPLFARNFTYPANPMLKVTPDFVTGLGINETFTMDVWLQGSDSSDLDPFWDVAGCDFYLNFNTTLIEALDITIDPDGDFGAFWSDGTYPLWKEINNTEGSLHIAFMGFGETHDPVNGTIRVANITFNVIYESALAPVEPIDLENPLVPSTWYILNSEGGIIDLSAPVTTDWLALFATSRYGLGFDLTDWTDEDGDGQLSVGDQINLLNNETLKTHDYYLKDIKGTLELSMVPWTEFEAVGDYVGAFSYFEHFIGDTPGNAYLSWGNLGVNQINVTFGNYTERELAPGEYIEVSGENRIYIDIPLDVVIVENCTLGVDAWLPWVEYPSHRAAKDIIKIHVYWENGTDRDLVEDTEWFHDPDWPCEMGCPMLDPAEFPDGTIFEGTFVAYPFPIGVNYEATGIPQTKYVEFEGTYDDFLALGDPMYTLWHEIYIWYCNTWNLTAFDDVDVSGNITISDYIILDLDGANYTFQVTGVSTDIKVLQKPCVQDIDPGDPYYTNPIIVKIAGYPHPERAMSPWYGRSGPVPLPNTVENSSFQAIPEFNGLFAMLPLLMLATIAIAITRKLPKKK